MNKEAHQKDPRFYYIRIMDLKIDPTKLKFQKVLVKLHLGTKYSDTVFSLSDFKDPKKKERIYEEAHIFKYGGEEFFNVYLEEALEVQHNDKKEEDKKGGTYKTQKEIKGQVRQNVSGYTRILLPPLIEYPHICHQVKANFICVKNRIEFTKEILAEITFQLYYRLDFRGLIDIIPLAANLERNVAQFGQMKPFVELSVEGQTWTSLQAQGIHPRWSGHFQGKKQKISDRKGHYLIKNVQNNVDLNTHSIQQRKLFHAENFNTRQEYFDIARFSLVSAGSFLVIKVFSYPIIGKNPDLVGQAQIRISNAGFFRHPNSEQQAEFIEKDIKLFIKEQGEKVNVGNFTVLIRFIFDKNNVLDGGPYIEQMPVPRVQYKQVENINH